MNKQEKITSKIVTREALPMVLARLRFLNNKIVFTNGCFDIIHRGHIEYLSQAADLGNLLFVGLNSDRSVRSIKGANRPVQDEITRAKVLSSFFFVDYVFIFDEDTPYNLIELVQPDVLVKGGDYQLESIVGYDIVSAKGGQVLTIPFVDGYSTTEIIEKIQK